MNKEYIITGSTVIVSDEKGNVDNLPYNRYIDIKLGLENIVHNVERELDYLNRQFLSENYLYLFIKIVAGLLIINISSMILTFPIINVLTLNEFIICSFFSSLIYFVFSYVIAINKIKKEHKKRLQNVTKLLIKYKKELLKYRHLYYSSSLIATKANNEECGSYVFDNNILEHSVYSYYDISCSKSFVRKKVKKL